MVDAVALMIDASVQDATARFLESLGLEKQVRLRSGPAPREGFRGFTLSLVFPQPADVDEAMSVATATGGAVITPAKKSLWGYGGAVRSPDGTLVTVASSSKKNTGPATRVFESFVVQLGVADVAASREFYETQGIGTAKSYGKRYAELDTPPVTVSLNPRTALAKTVGVAPDGTGSHGVVLLGGHGVFVDPDGFEWENA